MTTFGDMVYGMGGVPLIPNIPFGKKAKYYFVDPTNGSDNNDGESPDRPKATLLSAYNKTVSGQNDTIFYIAGTSAITLTAALDWDHSYTHLIGVCAPNGIAQRARIFQLSTLTSASPLITVSGSGCIFKNLYIFQGVDDAGSLVAVSVTGSRNYFENVHFAGAGHTSNAIDGAASLLINGGEENKFVGCTLGVDTVVAATGTVNLQFDNLAARNTFIDCTFLLYAGATGCAFVEIMDSAGMDRFNRFKNCEFINDCVTYSLASAFLIPASMHSVTNFLLVKDCMSVGVTKNDANDRGVLYGNMNAVTAADLSGVAVLMSV